MKYYKITYYDDNLGSCIDWATSQPEAKKIAKQLLEDGSYSIEVKPEDVPTSKAELLSWLRYNIKTDNG